MIKIAVAVLGFLVSLSSSALQVAISAKPDGSTTPVITGFTNLPEGTALMVSVERPQIDWGGDSNTVVMDGKFTAGPFGPPGKGLSPGTYNLTVTMAVPLWQPPNVLEEIGNAGQKLTGKLVRKDSITGGRHATYSTSFKISGTQNAKQDALERSQRDAKNKVQFCSDGCALHSKGNALSYDICIRSCLRP